MRLLLVILTLLTASLPLAAQTNGPVRLALISQGDDTANAATLLTAQLSGNANIQLLERDQVAKVYREQGSAAANQNDVAVGRILGADGLLVLEVVRTSQATNLMARLIAVKPGVVLSDRAFAWPMPDLVAWAGAVTESFNAFVPKLALPVKDAIPISVVNLRSAIASETGQETERDLKLLTIQRLSQEPQLFVLERQKMQRLGDEKSLNADDSAFWSGSYLLDGVVDRDGYSPDTVTINARLTPPKGGTPLEFVVTGSRTNLAMVAGQLAAKAITALQIQSSAPEWKPAEEAGKFYAEGKWALHWGIYAEAESDADSAWALGKTDLDCASLQVNSYLADLSARVGKYERVETALEPFFDANNRPTGPAPTEAAVQSAIQENLANHPFGGACRASRAAAGYVANLEFAFGKAAPDPANINRAGHLLDLYYNYARNHEDGVPKAGTAETSWKSSDWYSAGVNVLAAVAAVLQNFNFVPASQNTVADQLGELRARTRAVADLISASPSVRDSYPAGDEVATHDQLAVSLQDSPNLFKCKAAWGAYWQDRPEDALALYRGLMASPAFSYVHTAFWQRDIQTPRLVAWNDDDRRRIPQLWSDFVQELEASTNVLWQLEGRALVLADASNENDLGNAFTNFFKVMFDHRDALIANPVEVLYLGFDSEDLVSGKMSGTSSDTKDSMEQLFNSQYSRQLSAMDQEYWNKTVHSANASDVFSKQKEYLKGNEPYDFLKFVELFATRDFSKAQAREIRPLIAAYKANLDTQIKTAAGFGKAKLMGAVGQVEMLQEDVEGILNPPAPQPRPPMVVKAPEPVVVPPPAIKAPAAPVAPPAAPEIPTNIIVVNKFLAIPLDGPPGTTNHDITITAHHWVEGKLVLDLQYQQSESYVPGDGWVGMATLPAIAILDPMTEQWQVATCPEVDVTAQTYFYHHSTLLHGELFSSDGGRIRKYDFNQKQWQVLAVSDGQNYELFTVNDHLYAANGTMIFEITNAGASTRILASTRRTPSVSALDNQELGTPILFAGPGGSLRVSTGKKIYTWMGSDWRVDSTAPPATLPGPESPEGMLFVTDGFYRPACLSWLATDTNAAVYGLGNFASSQSGVEYSPPGEPPIAVPRPLWALPRELSLARLAAAVHESSWYLLAGHSGIETIRDGATPLVLREQAVDRDGYNAAVLCFSPNLPHPQKAFLKFDAPNGCPPLAGLDPTSRQMFNGPSGAWMFFAGRLIMFASEIPTGTPLVNGIHTRAGYQAGIWIMPEAQLDSALAGQGQPQLAEMARATNDAAQTWKSLLAKYDLNHNGVIDPDEREDALSDPAFIEASLDQIDTNHNGVLDAPELAWFDANHNRRMDPDEEIGLNTAQRLFTERLLKKFDVNGDGRLELNEFLPLVQTCLLGQPRSPSFLEFHAADLNQDGYIDLKELEAYWQDQLVPILRSAGTSGRLFVQPRIPGMRRSEDSEEKFIEAVEHYWRHTGAPWHPQPTGTPGNL